MSVCKVLRFMKFYGETFKAERIENELNKYLAAGYSVKAMSAVGENELYVILER